MFASIRQFGDKYARQREIAFEIAESIVMLAVVSAIVIYAFQGFFWVVGLTGLTLNLPAELATWYSIGLIGSVFWPFRYRRQMERKDWLGVAKGIPFVALAGPVAFLLGFPL